MRRWQHKKRGTQYVEVGLAMLQSEIPVGENTTLVVYRGEDGGVLWARLNIEFCDGRFVRLRDTIDDVPHHLSANNSVAVADALTYLPMDTCPLGVKVLLLNLGGVATLGVVKREDRSEWRGWFPLPKERKTP